MLLRVVTSQKFFLFCCTKKVWCETQLRISETIEPCRAILNVYAYIRNVYNNNNIKIETLFERKT